MNELEIFNNQEFGQIRATEINGEPYFVGKDAVRIYNLAEKIDMEDLKEYRIEPTKVRITSVSKVTGISVNLMKKQAEEEQA